MVKPTVTRRHRSRAAPAGRWSGRFSVALGLILGAALVPAGAAAQDVPLSVELLAGTCDQPGTPVAAAADAASGDGQGSIAPQLIVAAEALGGPVDEGSLTVLGSLADIAASDHAIGVRAAQGDPNTGLACGELGVFAPSGPDVQVGLGGPEHPGLGVAWLHDNGNGTTTVSVVLTSDREIPPVQDAPSVEVAMIKSVYGPNPLEIAPGTTVTWANEDLLPHTVTEVDFAFDSGYMAQGDTWTRTFEEPGTYPYFCLYHPRMRGVVIVE